MIMMIKAGLLAIAMLSLTGILWWRAIGQPAAPVQPVAFNHWQHVTKAEGPQMECVACHEHADKSRSASIPNVALCMSCHETMNTESAEVQKLTEIAARGEQPAWVRVFFLEDSADVFYTHKPHVKAGIACATCHGQVGQMHEVRREVDQSMSWCIKCHREQRVSIDCYVCHR